MFKHPWRGTCLYEHINIIPKVNESGHCVPTFEKSKYLTLDM